jgi:hypothetical protein
MDACGYLIERAEVAASKLLLKKLPGLEAVENLWKKDDPKAGQKFSQSEESKNIFPKPRPY